MQKKLPQVAWGDQIAGNNWVFKYLGSLFEAGGNHMPDVRRRIAMARTRFGKLRHIWGDKRLHKNLRIRLYKAAVCSILTYGSEAWYLDADVRRALNGANSQMMSVITGKTPHQEASAKWRTFDLVMWIRARRLQWLGHILRTMDTERSLKRAAFVMFKHPREGDLLMDAPEKKSWRALVTWAMDREKWRERVRRMRQPRIRVELGAFKEEGRVVSFTVSS